MSSQEMFKTETPMLKFQANSQAVWASTEAASKGPIQVRIAGLTDESEYDREEVGLMYDIQLPDGSSYSAFEDELSQP